jgi:anti-anti-sigma factor
MSELEFAHIAVSMVKDVAVVEIQIREVHQPKLAEELGTELAMVATQDWAKRLVVNCRKLSFLSSTGFAMIFKLVAKARTNGHEVKFCELESGVKLGAEIIGLHQLIEIYDTEREALASFQ